ncbi:MAG: DUF262 domain-containing HNH endonuclease family protein [Chloroflexi bacterium]|nr:DUF262 domain-containing HNH endonuclease family protein [Chloroflexota bacterium]
MNDLIKPLSEIFANRVFFVPDYQRGYAWGEKQWDDLIKDLELLTDGRKHYTGTLVIFASSTEQPVKDGQGQDYQPFDVIDGQQRLTTCILFLKAIYDEMQLLPDFKSLAENMQALYFSNPDVNQFSPTRLTLNQDCREFFANNILGLGPDIKKTLIRAHKNLENGKKHFTQYLHKMRAAQGDEYPIWLKKVYLKITERISLIVYQVDDDLDAGIIFETMNDRGMELTELEKVKNYLLYVSSKLDLTDKQHAQALKIQINQTWTHILEKLMSADIIDKESEDQLLRAHWLMAYDYSIQNWKNSRSIKEEFSLEKYQGKHAQLLDDLKIYLDTLKEAATAYCDIKKPERPNAFSDIKHKIHREQIIDLSTNLARLGARASFQPILMAVRLKSQDDGLTYALMVELCERFDFRVYQWLRYQSRTGQTQLFRLGYEYFKAADSKDLEYGLKQNLFEYCPDDHFTQRFSDETEDWYHWDGLKYFLYEYERSKIEKNNQQVGRKLWKLLNTGADEADSIEHILPQNPDSAYWLKRFNLAARKRWTNNIGNLTLTLMKNNIELSNKPFRNNPIGGDKVSLYGNSSLLVEQELQDIPHWTVAEIKKRRDAIKGWAIERWHVDPARGNPKVERADPGTFEKVLAQAEKKQVLPELNQLIDLIHKQGFYARPYTNCITCTPPFNKAQALFTVTINDSGQLNVDFWFETLGKLYPVSSRILKSIIGEQKQCITVSQIPDFLTRLEALFIRLNATNN